MKKYILFCLIVFTGCQNWLELETIGSKVEENYIKDLRSAVYAYNGIDKSFINLWDGMPTLLEAICDDAFSPSASDAPSIIAVDQLNIDFRTGTNFYGTCYTGINRINTALHYIEKLKLPASDQSSLDIVKGQMYFMRAFFYFTLIRLYGEVPIMPKINNAEDAKQPRSTINQLYSYIEQDLSKAISLLPNSLNGKLGQERGKPYKASAYALQADFYAYFEKWDLVLAITNFFINNSSFEKTAYSSIFHWEDELKGFDYSNDYLKEVILDANYDDYGKQKFTWEFVPKGYVSTMTKGRHRGILYATSSENDPEQTEVPSGGSKSKNLMDLYEISDIRLEYFWKDTHFEAKNFYGTLKFYGATFGYNSTLVNYPIYRFSEIVLLRVEALNEKGETKEAMNILNSIIRDKVKASKLQTEDKKIAREWIMDERRRELCFECKRFFDLNRWGIMADVLEKQEKIQGKNITPHLIINPITNKKHFVFPLPLKEINANPHITDNNPGY